MVASVEVVNPAYSASPATASTEAAREHERGLSVSQHITAASSVDRVSFQAAGNEANARGVGVSSNGEGAGNSSGLSQRVVKNDVVSRSEKCATPAPRPPVKLPVGAANARPDDPAPFAPHTYTPHVEGVPAPAAAAIERTEAGPSASRSASTAHAAQGDDARVRKGRFWSWLSRLFT